MSGKEPARKQSKSPVRKQSKSPVRQSAASGSKSPVKKSPVQEAREELVAEIEDLSNTYSIPWKKVVVKHAPNTALRSILKALKKETKTGELDGASSSTGSKESSKKSEETETKVSPKVKYSFSAKSLEYQPIEVVYNHIMDRYLPLMEEEEEARIKSAAITDEMVRSAKQSKTLDNFVEQFSTACEHLTASEISHTSAIFNFGLMLKQLRSFQPRGWVKKACEISGKKGAWIRRVYKTTKILTNYVHKLKRCAVSFTLLALRAECFVELLNEMPGNDGEEHRLWWLAPNDASWMPPLKIEYPVADDVNDNSDEDEEPTPKAAASAAKAAVPAPKAAAKAAASAPKDSEILSGLLSKMDMVDEKEDKEDKEDDDEDDDDSEVDPEYTEEEDDEEED